MVQKWMGPKDNLNWKDSYLLFCPDLEFEDDANDKLKYNNDEKSKHGDDGYEDDDGK